MVTALAVGLACPEVSAQTTLGHAPQAQPSPQQTFIESSFNRARLPYDAPPGRYLVQLTDEQRSVWSTPEDLKNLLGEGSGSARLMVGIDGIAVVEGATIDAATLARQSGVALVEPDHVVYALEGLSQDTFSEYMWHLERILAGNAWRIRHDSPEVVVAVVDSGMDIDHEDLRDNIWQNPYETPGNGIDDDGNGFIDDIVGWDFFSHDNDPSPELVGRPTATCDEKPGSKWDYEGHGTHVAGTIGAVGGNQRGVSGVTHKVKIMPLKALGGPCGSGHGSDILQAVLYAARNGAQVINLSFGSYRISELAERVYRLVGEAGVAMVAAAGNEGVDTDRMPHFPASYKVPGMMSVAATRYDDQLAWFSNYGANSVDLAAPGEDILSTFPPAFGERLGATGPNPSRYAVRSGTSMAAPVVSGALALLKAHYPSARMETLVAHLMTTAQPVPALSTSIKSGGRLDLARALSTPPRPGLDHLGAGVPTSIPTHVTGGSLAPMLDGPRPSIDLTAPPQSFNLNSVDPR